MKYLKITNKSNNKIVGDNIGKASNMLQRAVGLMGKKELKDNEGLFLTPCNSIHMMWMRMSLDVVFLDRKNKVLYILEDFKPWKVSKIVFKAQSVVELPVGAIQKSGIKIDDILEIEQK